MIEVVREWITSIVMVTMLLTVAQSMIPEGRIQKIFSFSGGLVLLIALLQPVLNLDPVDVDFHMETYEEEVRIRQEELTRAAGAEWETIIEQETAAYISDKAESLGLDVSVRVRAESDGENPPILTTEITGETSESLAMYLVEELGIPRERQVWNNEGDN